MVGDEVDTGCAYCGGEGAVHAQVACQDGCAKVDEWSLLAGRSSSAGSHQAYGWAFISHAPDPFLMVISVITPRAQVEF